MKLSGVQLNGNPILLEVVSAEIDIFKSVMLFKTTIGETWKLPFRSQTGARMMLSELRNTGLLNIEELDDDPYFALLRKE